jgi:hypothetical protein
MLASILSFISPICLFQMWLLEARMPIHIQLNMLKHIFLAKTVHLGTNVIKLFCL